MLTRRHFIRTAALFALAPRILAEPEREIWVNDVHSQLNRTRVRELLVPHIEISLQRSCVRPREKPFLFRFRVAGIRWVANNLPQTAFASIRVRLIASFLSTRNAVWLKPKRESNGRN